MDDKTKKLIEAIEARWSKATPGPIDVHRFDDDGGLISWQLQQSADAPKAKTDHELGTRVLTEFSDIDNPDARHDAEACAKAYEDVPALIAVVKEQGKRIAELEGTARLLGKEWDLCVEPRGFGRYSVTEYVFNAVKRLHALVERKDYEW